MATALMASPPMAEASRGKAKVKPSAAKSKQKQTAKARVKANKPGKTSKGANKAKPGQSTIGSGFFRNPAGGSGGAPSKAVRTATSKPAATAKSNSTARAKAKPTTSASKVSQKNVRITNTKSTARPTRTASSSRKAPTRRQARTTSRQRATSQRARQKAQRPARQARATQSQQQQVRGPRVQTSQAPRVSLGRRIAGAAGKIAKGAGLVVLVAAPTILFPMAGLPIVAGLTASGFLGVGAIAGTIERSVKARNGGQLSGKEQMLGERGLTPEQRYIYANRAMIQQHQLGN